MTSSSDVVYTTVTEADQVTEEILEDARQAADGWFRDTRIDWESVWDRIEGKQLNDGTVLDLGNEAGSPAMRHIQKVINKERRES